MPINTSHDPIFMNLIIKIQDEIDEFLNFKRFLKKIKFKNLNKNPFLDFQKSIFKFLKIKQF